ncbi:MAG: B12-binding domain-containing radical SAM protein [Mediterraneibacter gnavus]|uniref:B12-binding domain-containing radical SAM protein n=1 Tax=Mediterraneibacter sp. TaxID=2316022 RepID=UPI00399402F4
MEKNKIIFVYIPDCSFVSEETTPYGQICLYDIIKKDGIYEAEILDFNKLLSDGLIEHNNNDMLMIFKAMAEYIAKKKADIVSFYTMCSNFYACIPTAYHLKKINAKIKIIMAGPHATCIAENILHKYKFVDYVALGEGEKSILPMMGAILKSESFKNINGIGYRENQKIVIQWDRKNRLDKNLLPVFDICEYTSIQCNEFITIEGGRGCPFSCAFCSTQMFWGNVFVVKPIEQIIFEIKYYYYKYGLTKFSITHDLFTANKTYILQFCNEIEKLPFKIQWSCSSRLDVLDDSMRKAMVKSGCSDIYIGVESGSERIQELISKNLDLSLLDETVSYFLSEGVSCVLSFVYGYGFESRDDFEMTLQMIYKVKKIEKKYKNGKLTIQLHRLTYLPATKISEEYFDKLQYEGLNNMSYFDEDIIIPKEIENMILDNKHGFLNCYNLVSKMDKYTIHIGDFVCFLFDFMYYYFSETIDGFISQFNNLCSMFEYVYQDYEEYFLEISRFCNLYYEANKIEIMCDSFSELMSNICIEKSFLGLYEKLKEEDNNLIQYFSKIKNGDN